MIDDFVSSFLDQIIYVRGEYQLGGKGSRLNYNYNYDDSMNTRDMESYECIVKFHLMSSVAKAKIKLTSHQ
jgi:hypothetical protein